MKQCIICGTDKVNNPAKDWHKGPKCKRCYGREKAKENYLQNPEKVKSKNKKWVMQNKDLVKTINSQWACKNPEKIKSYNKRAKPYKANFYLKNKEKYKQKHADYYQLNKEKIIAQNLQKRRLNPLVRLRHNMSTYVNKSLTKFKTNKAKKLVELVGLSLKELKTYIELQFQPGMTWDNYGQWHIDHICPLSQALNEQELYKLWNYMNLRPMWATQNFAKSNHPIQDGRDLCLKLLQRNWNVES
jgi:hypothetical protein